MPASASFDSAAPMNPTGIAEHRGGPRRTGVDHVEQVEQGGRGVADRDDGAVEPVAPELERGGAAGGAPFRRERGDPRVAQRADDVVVGGQARRG